MNVKIFTFVRDEEYLMKVWIPYHSSIFGKENIFVIDHLSEDRTSQIIKDGGVNYFKYEGDFRNKRFELSRVMNEVKDIGDILVPIDADEFLCFQENNQVKIEGLLTKFQELPKNNLKYKMGCFMAYNDKIEYEDPLKDMVYFDLKNSESSGQNAKTFYPSDKFIRTDQGNHGGKIRGKNYVYNFVDICLLHYEIRGFEHFKSKSIRGVKSYGYDKNVRCKKGKNGYGGHWKMRYDHIVNNNDEGFEEFRREFLENRSSSLISHTFSDYIKALTNEK